MSSMTQKEIRSAKVLVKKLGGHSGLEQSLKQLQETIAEVEEALVSDMDAAEVKELLAKAAAQLKALKKIMNQVEA